MIKRRPLLAALLAPTLLWVGTAAALPASKDAAPVVGDGDVAGRTHVLVTNPAHPLDDDDLDIVAWAP